MYSDALFALSGQSIESSLVFSGPFQAGLARELKNAALAGSAWWAILSNRLTQHCLTRSAGWSRVTILMSNVKSRTNSNGLHVGRSQTEQLLMFVCLQSDQIKGLGQKIWSINSRKCIVLQENNGYRTRNFATMRCVFDQLSVGWLARSHNFLTLELREKRVRRCDKTRVVNYMFSNNRFWSHIRHFER